MLESLDLFFRQESGRRGHFLEFAHFSSVYF